MIKAPFNLVPTPQQPQIPHLISLSPCPCPFPAQRLTELDDRINRDLSESWQFQDHPDRYPTGVSGTPARNTRPEAVLSGTPNLGGPNQGGPRQSLTASGEGLAGTARL